MKSSRNKSSTHWLFLLLPLLAILMVAIYSIYKTQSPPHLRTSSIALEESHPASLSSLDKFQAKISRDTFLKRLTTTYTLGPEWKKWFSFSPDNTSVSFDQYVLKFSEHDEPIQGSSWNWKTRENLSPQRSLPLSGLHIAIDPGHIGGNYASLEEREYQYGPTLIREGSMTLKTGTILKHLLEKQGATVSLVRSTNEPVTQKRLEDFRYPVDYYRKSEIHARAKLINEEIQPDLVICLHFNGSASKTPESTQHFHILLNGTYTDSEISLPEVRHRMIQKILSRSIELEIPLAKAIASAFNRKTNLPPFLYSPTAPNAQNLGNHPNLWARNLLANRLYQCPVIFMEPYVMNSTPFIERFQKNPTEIFNEYALAVSEGIVNYYSQK